MRDALHAAEDSRETPESATRTDHPNNIIFVHTNSMDGRMTECMDMHPALSDADLPP